jgi:hypothetical protein
MYWLLLPPSANAGRHIDDNSRPSSRGWGAFTHAAWNKVFVGSHRTPSGPARKTAAGHDEKGEHHDK